VHAKHHPGAASVGLVVDLAGGEGRVVPVVEEPKVELVSEHGRNRPLLREPGERMREESEDVELQETAVKQVSCEARSLAQWRFAPPRDPPSARRPRRAGAAGRNRARARRWRPPAALRRPDQGAVLPPPPPPGRRAGTRSTRPRPGAGGLPAGR